MTLAGHRASGIITVATSAVAAPAESSDRYSSTVPFCARVEQVRQFRVLDEAWEPGSEQLTPTMKLRRRVIDKLYASTIEELYAAEPLRPTA